jgi:hypothetical protein
MEFYCTPAFTPSITRIRTLILTIQSGPWTYRSSRGRSKGRSRRGKESENGSSLHGDNGRSVIEEVCLLVPVPVPVVPVVVVVVGIA